MVLLVILAFKFMVTLVITTHMRILPIAREMVRVQLQYVANAPALFAQILGVDPPPGHYSCCSFEQPIQLQYSPLALRPPTVPPTRTLPGTPTTSSSRRIDIKSTAAPHPPPTPAPEDTSFDLAERTYVASAKHWCPSLKTVAGAIDAIHAALALFALTYIPKLLILAYAVVTGSLRYWIPAAPTAPSRRDQRHREKNRGRLRRERKARSVAALAARE